jgi:hypothetical protein
VLLTLLLLLLLKLMLLLLVSCYCYEPLLLPQAQPELQQGQQLHLQQQQQRVQWCACCAWRCSCRCMGRPWACCYRLRLEQQLLLLLCLRHLQAGRMRHHSSMLPPWSHAVAAWVTERCQKYPEADLLLPLLLGLRQLCRHLVQQQQLRPACRPP